MGLTESSMVSRMFRIARMTDYGFVLLTRMAVQPERSYNARDLAAETRLPVPTVSKILKTLVRAGLLSSQRGVQGGYTLSKRPQDISVADVIMTLEGPVAITRCGHGPGHCRLEACCPVGPNWQRINRAVLGTLENHAPGLLDLVEDRVVLGPPDLERRFGLVGGNIFHGELLPEWLFDRRPGGVWHRYRLPLPGYYLCGSGAHPGGGVCGAPDPQR